MPGAGCASTEAPHDAHARGRAWGRSSRRAVSRYEQPPQADLSALLRLPRIGRKLSVANLPSPREHSRGAIPHLFGLGNRRRLDDDVAGWTRPCPLSPRVVDEEIERSPSSGFCAVALLVLALEMGSTRWPPTTAALLLVGLHVQARGDPDLLDVALRIPTSRYAAPCRAEQRVGALAFERGAAVIAGALVGCHAYSRNRFALRFCAWT